MFLDIEKQYLKVIEDILEYTLDHRDVPEILYQIIHIFYSACFTLLQKNLHIMFRVIAFLPKM